MINCTEQAIKKINQLLTRRGKGMGIRIAVKTTGCSGLAYVLEYVDNIEEGDDVVLCDNFSIAVNKKDIPYLKGLTVDFLKEGLNEGFKFTNPNEKDRCGCGESFRI